MGAPEHQISIQSARALARPSHTELVLAGAGSHEFAWIATLPIACAIVETRPDHLEVVKTNRLFDELGHGEGRQIGLDLAEVAAQIAIMASEGRLSHHFRWLSADPVRRCHLDLTIARYGAIGQRYILSVIDRTREALDQAALRREMSIDALTGFANRPGFEEEIDAALAAMPPLDNGEAQRFGIVSIDMARFSRINECAGTLAGDELIITVARRLRGAIREGDIIGRIGGDEFALFARLQAQGELDRLVERIEDTFRQPFRLSNLEIQVDCAVGAAVGFAGHDDAAGVVRHAQIALKRAKTSKRFERYDPAAFTAMRHRFTLETELRHAIERGQLSLHYQPLVGLASGSLGGFEALARWNHPDRGMISPVEFIPVAEESGLIVPLGRWAIDEAARTLAVWDKRQGRKLPIKLSVNLSPVQLERDDVARVVESAIAEHGIDGQRLMLELTETALVADPDGVRRMMEALKGLGAFLAMDDFGTGYSNLAFLQRLPLDVLKIDRSFVTGMMIDKDKLAIVRAVLSLAKALGMNTTAEGVETQELSAELTRLGCSFGQGYFFSPPVPADRAYNFIAAATR